MTTNLLMFKVTTDHGTGRVGYNSPAAWACG